MTATTPIYGIEYLVEGEPVRNTRAALENNALTIEAALAARGVPPADLVTLIAAGWFSDTGWVTIVPNTGFTASESLAYRVRGGTCFLRGTVIRTAGAFTTTPTAVFTMPTGARPSSFLRFPATAGMAANVNTSGVVEIFADTLTGADRTRLSVVRFLVA